MLWICLGCTTAYAVGLPKCPHCGGKKWCEQGSDKHQAMLATIPEQAPPDGGAPDVDG